MNKENTAKKTPESDTHLKVIEGGAETETIKAEAEVDTARKRVETAIEPEVKDEILERAMEALERDLNLNELRELARVCEGQGYLTLIKGGKGKWKVEVIEEKPGSKQLVNRINQKKNEILLKITLEKVTKIKTLEELKEYAEKLTGLVRVTSHGVRAVNAKGKPVEEAILKRKGELEAEKKTSKALATLGEIGIKKAKK